MLVLTETQLQDCIKDLRSSKKLYHDTETTGLFPFKKIGNPTDPGGARIAGHAFQSDDSKRKYYIPIRHETIIESNLTYSIPPSTPFSVFGDLMASIEHKVGQVVGPSFIAMEPHVTGYSTTKKAQAKRQTVKIRLHFECYVDDYDYVLCEKIKNVVDEIASKPTSMEGLHLRECTTNIYAGCYSEYTHKIKNWDPAHVNSLLIPVFDDETKTIKGFNYKFDLSVLRFDGIVPKAYVEDVMVNCHLSQENEYNFQLKTLGIKYVRPDARDQQEFVKEYMKKWKLKRYSQVPANILGEYAEMDVELTGELDKKTMESIEAQKLTDLSVKDYTKNLVYKEARFLRLLDKMWYAGIAIDPKKCAQSIKEADKRCSEIAEMASEIAGFEINLNSPVQLMKVLGLESTDKQHLMQCNHPIAALTLEYRAWQKVKTAYYIRFLEDRDENNRLHPDLFQIGTVTGRLSCRDPNFQALPRLKDDDDPFAHIYKVRDVVVPPGPDYALVFSDLSQAEMRVAAHYAKEYTMIEIIKAGGDLHTQTAIAMFGDKCIDPATGKVYKEYRNFAKRLNFGIIYGMGAKALAEQLKCSIEKAKELLEQYHERFPGFKKLYSNAEMKALTRGYIKMWTGRRRRFRGDTVELWECRKAMNNLIQGSVSEMMKHSMLRIDELLVKETNNRSYIFNQVHDDLHMAIHKDDWHLIPKIRDIMQDHPWCIVPIVTDTEYSLTSWGEKKKWTETENPWAA